MRIVNKPGAPEYNTKEAAIDDLQKSILDAQEKLSNLKNVKEEWEKVNEEVLAIEEAGASRGIIEVPYYETKEEFDYSYGLDTLSEIPKKTVTYPIYSPDKEKELRNEYSDKLSNEINPKYSNLHKRLTELNTLRGDSDEWLPLQNRRSELEGRIKYNEKKIEDNNAFLDQTKTIISLEAEDFDSQGLLKEEVKNKLTNVQFTPEQIKKLETLYGIQKCLDTAPNSLQTEFKLIREASLLDSISADKVQDKVERIQKLINIDIDYLNKGLERLNNSTPKAKTGFSAAVEFLKNLATTIINKDKSTLPFVERFQQERTKEAREHENKTQEKKSGIAKLQEIKGSLNDMKHTSVREPQQEEIPQAPGAHLG